MSHLTSPGAMIGIAIAIGVALWIVFTKKKR